MTCLAAWNGGDTAYMGADSGCARGAVLTTIKTQKVFRLGEMLVGVTGTFRAAQLMQCGFDVPDRGKSKSDEMWFRTDFLDALRKRFTGAGAQTIKDSMEEFDATFLIIYRGHIWRLSCDWSVIESVDQFDAAGSGEQIALGVLYALKDVKMPPRQKVLRALKAAAYLTPWVAEPFAIKTTKMRS